MIAGGDDPCLATCVEGKLEEMSERELWGQRWARKLLVFQSNGQGLKEWIFGRLQDQWVPAEGQVLFLEALQCPR